MKKKGNQRKEQLLCLLAGAALAAVSAVCGGTKDLFREGETVMVLRPAYGEQDREQTLTVNGEEITFTVTGRKYAAEEAEQILSRLTEALLSEEDPEHRSSYEGYEGVQAEWSEGESGPVCRLSVRTEEGTLERTVNFPETHAEKAVQEDAVTFAERVGELLALSDLNGVTEERLVLPAEADGVRLTYEEKKNRAPWILLLLGVVSAVLVAKKPQEEEKKRRKMRETELLLDYSDVVSKLLIFLGAGLTVKNAFGKLCENGPGPKRAVDEEIARTLADMENGIPEGEALSAFASRCGPACYVRLASLLERNQKTGGNSVRAELELEMQEAFAQRKEAAKRLGEEAGTRLLFPLLMSLAAVLLVTAVPAFLKMQM